MAGESASNMGGGGGGGEAPATRSNFMSDMRAQDSAVRQQPQAPQQRPLQQQRVANDNAGRAAGADDLHMETGEPSLAEQVLADDEGAIPEIEALQDDEDAEQQAQQVDPLDEELHGVKARELLESLKQGIIPKELHDKMQFEIDVNGVPRVMTATELGKGYMRQADYTKGKQQVAEAKRENEAFTESFNRRMQEANEDPTGQKFQKLMRRMQMGQAFYRAAQALATEMDRIGRLPPHEQEREWQLKRLAEEAEELRERAAMNEETAAAKRQRQAKERIQHQFNEFTPIAFARAGNLAMTPYNRNVYISNLRALQEPGQPLTLELCTQAAVATVEQLGDEARENQQTLAQRAKAQGAMSPAQQQLQATQQAAQQPQRRLPARPGAAGAPATGGGAGGLRGGGTGGTAQDFQKWVRSQSGR